MDQRVRSTAAHYLFKALLRDPTYSVRQNFGNCRIPASFVPPTPTLNRYSPSLASGPAVVLPLCLVLHKRNRSSSDLVP